MIWRRRRRRRRRSLLRIVHARGAIPNEGDFVMLVDDRGPAQHPRTMAIAPKAGSPNGFTKKDSTTGA